MKISKFAALYFTSCFLILSGCKKNTSAPAELKNTVTFTFKGTKYSFSNPIVTTGDDYLGISGSQNGSGIYVYVANYAIGTFQVGEHNNNAVLPQPSISTTGYSSPSGTITITSLTSTEAIGNFQCMAVQIGQNIDTAAPITGTFDVTLPQ